MFSKENDVFYLLKYFLLTLAIVLAAWIDIGFWPVGILTVIYFIFLWVDYVQDYHNDR